MMNYYNVHTHDPGYYDPEITEIVNIVIKEGYESNNAPFRSYGIHPWYIYNVEDQMKELRNYTDLKETVAIGEAGLDKLTETDFTLQEKVFRLQAKLAGETGKPLIIHCVKAWAELMAIKKDIAPSVAWIIHGFRGKPELAAQLTEHGFQLSFGAQFNPASLQKAWPEHLLAETDEADIDIKEVYRRIASALNLQVETVASQLTENSNHIFCFLK